MWSEPNSVAVLTNSPLKLVLIRFNVKSGICVKITHV